LAVAVFVVLAKGEAVEVAVMEEVVVLVVGFGLKERPAFFEVVLIFSFLSLLIAVILLFAVLVLTYDAY
jgi:hypothetical protein